MTIEEQVFSLLSGAGPVTAIVPASQIKPQGDWQGLTLPYIVHFPVEPTIEYMHGARVPLTEWMYQVSCFGASYAAVRPLAQAVVAALDGNHSSGVTFFWKHQLPQFEPNPPVSHIALTFQVFEAL